MKNFQIKIILLFLCGLMTGCSIEDVKPINQLTTDTVIKDANSAQYVLNGIYDTWREFDLSFFPIHLGALGIEGVIQGNMKGSEGINTNQVPVENPYLSGVYNTLYKIVNDSNFLIQQLQAGEAVGITEIEKKRIISEAKFNRALAYFKLLKYFGQFYDLNSAYGVVIRTEFATKVEAKPRNTVQEVYDIIVKDLQHASQNGSDAVPHYVAGSLASTALLAKVYLYMGNYHQAAGLAKTVLNNNQGYGLEASYGAIFANTYNSKEALFVLFHNLKEGGVAMRQINRTGYSLIIANAADTQVAGIGDLTGVGTGYDPRFSYAYSAATSGINMMGKYLNMGFGDAGNTNYHLRMGEVYLIYAEAEARRTGGNLNAALGALNTIRARAGVSAKILSTQEQLLEDIREEKLLELFFENGEPWFDLIRYHNLGDIDAFSVKSTLKNVNQFTLPIPLKALSANNSLEQNPGY